jgi:hypothetical protein
MSRSVWQATGYVGIFAGFALLMPLHAAAAPATVASAAAALTSVAPAALSAPESTAVGGANYSPHEEQNGVVDDAFASETLSTEATRGFLIDTGQGPMRIEPVGTNPVTGYITPSGSATLFANTATDADTAIRPTATGVRVYVQMRSPAAPTAYVWTVSLRGGAVAPASGGGAGISTPSGLAASLSDLQGIDARGNSVPVSLAVGENTNSFTVHVPSSTLAYPVVLSYDISMPAPDASLALATDMLMQPMAASNIYTVIPGWATVRNNNSGSYVQGNAAQGWHFDATYRPGAWYYGFAANDVQHCAWILASDLSNSGSTSTASCSGSAPATVYLSSFAAATNCHIPRPNPNGLCTDGTYTTAIACPNPTEYANVRPWGDPSTPLDAIPSRRLGVGQALYWRYVTLDSAYALVRDPNVPDGQANWYFVSTQCINPNAWLTAVVPDSNDY